MARSLAAKRKGEGEGKEAGNEARRSMSGAWWAATGVVGWQGGAHDVFKSRMQAGSGS